MATGQHKVFIWRVPQVAGSYTNVGLCWDTAKMTDRQHMYTQA